MIHGGVEGAVQSVAGFASLHVAITLLVALMVQYTVRNRVLRIVFWVNFGLTVVATIYFGWHYIADDIAGVLSRSSPSTSAGSPAARSSSDTASPPTPPPTPPRSPSSTTDCSSRYAVSHHRHLRRAIRNRSIAVEPRPEGVAAVRTTTM